MIRKLFVNKPDISSTRKCVAQSRDKEDVRTDTRNYRVSYANLENIRLNWEHRKVSVSPESRRSRRDAIDEREDRMNEVTTGDIAAAIAIRRVGGLAVSPISVCDINRSADASDVSRDKAQVSRYTRRHARGVCCLRCACVLRTYVRVTHIYLQVQRTRCGFPKVSP